MKVCPRCYTRFPDGERFCLHDSAVLVEEEDIARLGTSIGNYRLDKILGRGGMGTVYAGEHIYIKRPVAVKILHPQFARYQEAIHRFLREARAATSINHANIVDVTDFGILAEGPVYFVMEFLDGKSLEDLIEKDGAVELHRALNVANQIALALEAAHAVGVIHRDLKPDNIMLLKKPGRRDLVRMAPDQTWITEREESYDFVKVLDFGIAKVLVQDELLAETVQGAVFGTPEYMSPEAARDLLGDVEDAPDGDGALLGNEPPDVLPVEVLHDEVRGAVVHHPEVADVDDVLVADARRALGLLAEARHHLRPAREVVAQQLDGHALLDDGVDALVDEAHAALADLPDDLVLVEHLPDERIVRDVARLHLRVRHHAGPVERAKDLAAFVLALTNWADLGGHH